MKEKIAIIFNKGLSFDMDTIKAEHLFSVNYIDIFDVKEITDKNMLLEYIVIIDCTEEQQYLELLKKVGTKIKSDIEYYQVSLGQNIVNIVGSQPFHNLFIKEENKSLYPENFIKKIDENKNLFIKTIDFFKTNMLKSVNNKDNFIEGLKQGIEVNFENTGKKRFVLINSFPEVREKGTEYIIPENIKILNELFSILQYKI